ncbi:acyltransferase [Herbidospora sp. NBRC 101105]|uniref:acyltransferase family protein n=1 Tax=Herbidospora sp. NBRC 101105 TaxID=3032195 RepID=UPI0024A08C65|nr:acyltransferase [Herbidospora sp. NBRC 101105]GLX96417.1 acyltransferase [Herbidospora sp. NBRC 101105]
MLISEPRTVPAAAAVDPPFVQPRLRVLDLLRFVAAMAVVLFHFGETRAWGTVNAFPALSGVTMFGSYGVRLFFMISGFVILMSAWGRTPGEFVVSRIARLYPAYWASVIILGGIALMGFITDHRPTLSELLANLTMFQHGLRIRDLEIVYWTLWHELVFYVMIACFAVVGITYRRVLGFMGGWIFLLALAERLDISLLKVGLAQFGAPYFIAGMSLYLIYRFGNSLLPWLFVGLAYAFGLVQLLGEGPSAIKRFGEPLGTALVVGVISLMFLVMILVALGRLDGIDWRGLTLLGALTYPLYLFHHHVGFLMIQWLNPVLGHRVTLPVVIGIVLVVAWAVYRFVEVPAQPRLKAALSRSLKIAD